MVVDLAGEHGSVEVELTSLLSEWRTVEFEASATVQEQTLGDHEGRVPLALSRDGVEVVVLAPVLEGLVDSREEEVGEQPLVVVKLWTEPVVFLERLEEHFPGGELQSGDVPPQALDPGVVNGTVGEEEKQGAAGKRGRSQGAYGADNGVVAGWREM